MPNDTYKSTSGGRSSVQMIYDPKLGKWVPVTGTASADTSDTLDSTNSSVEVAGDSEVNSKDAADKEYIEIEFNTLEGELLLTSTEKSIRVQVGNTIRLEGLGKYLSGLYFVSKVKRTLDKDNGYTHTFTVIKTGFGNSLKQVNVDKVSRAPAVKKNVGTGLKKGDKVRIVGADAVYSNAHEGVRVPNWVKQKTLTVDALSDDGARVRLQPIWSWTYVKFVQKV